MKKIILVILALPVIHYASFAQTKNLTVDANDILNNNTKIVAQTSAGQIFFTGHQIGSTYFNPSGIFRAWTDNPNGAANYFFDGVTNATTNFSVRADGQGYFAGNVGIGTTVPVAGLSTEAGQNAAISPLTDVPNGSAWIGGAGTTGGISMGQFSANYGYIQSRNKAANKTPYQLALNPLGGFVGIGTTTPNTLLDVNGVISMNGFAYLSSVRSPTNNYTNLFLGGALKDNGNGTYTAFGDGGSNYFGAIRMDNGSSVNNAGAINFYDGISVSGANYTISNANLANYLRMTISGSGNVGIGIAVPQNKLDVNGTIHSKSVLIDLNGWSDYVFYKDYKLPSLATVKTYIDQNQHLPEIPSEQEMVKKGLDLGEMNKLLMKKVEELTLYLIEMKAEIKELQKQNEFSKNKTN